MSIYEDLLKEWDYLVPHKLKAITISNTARASGEFKVLPRRFANETAVACFLINDSRCLEETLVFFDGKVDTIYIDVEQKQEIDLFHEAKQIVEKSELTTIKPNDIAIESCDLLLRKIYKDDLFSKNILVIGTGNLASKIALRLAERQAHVYMEGRSRTKEETIINGLNSFLPAYTYPINMLSERSSTEKWDAIISFLSGPYWGEESLLPQIDENTFIIDGGISNFSSSFVEHMLNQQTMITRLDVRFALPYQFLDTMKDTMIFYQKIYGKKKIGDHVIVAGGYIGNEGSIIVDQMHEPTQIIGIADGMGGVKNKESLTEIDKEAIKMVQDSIKVVDAKAE